MVNFETQERNEWPNYPPPAEYVARPQFFLPISSPLVTRILIGLNLLAFVAMIVYGYYIYQDWNGSENFYVLVTFGAKVSECIAQGQYYRLFSSMFLHIGLLHLLFNLYSLYSLGTLAEGYYGHWRFAAIYLFGGLFGSLASYRLSDALSAGASGAVFAIAGAVLLYFIYYRDNFGARGRALLQNLLVVLAINLVYGYGSQGIDNWAHLGGLVGGAVVAWGLLPRYASPQSVRPGPQSLQEEPRQPLETLWVLLCTGVLVGGAWWATQALAGSLERVDIASCLHLLSQVVVQ